MVSEDKIGVSVRETARRMLAGEISPLPWRSGDFIPDVVGTGQLEPLEQDQPAEDAPGSTNTPKVVQLGLWD